MVRLYGITSVQTYIYFNNSPRDGVYFKSTVRTYCLTLWVLLHHHWSSRFRYSSCGLYLSYRPRLIPHPNIAKLTRVLGLSTHLAHYLASTGYTNIVSKHSWSLPFGRKYHGSYLTVYCTNIIWREIRRSDGVRVSTIESCLVEADNQEMLTQTFS